MIFLNNRMLMPTHELWKKELGISNFRTSNKNLNLILTKSDKGMQKGVLLEMSLEDILAGRLKVKMMHDCTLIYLQKQNIL